MLRGHWWYRSEDKITQLHTSCCGAVILFLEDISTTIHIRIHAIHTMPEECAKSIISIQDSQETQKRTALLIYFCYKMLVYTYHSK